MRDFNELTTEEMDYLNANGLTPVDYFLDLEEQSKKVAPPNDNDDYTLLSGTTFKGYELRKYADDNARLNIVSMAAVNAEAIKRIDNYVSLDKVKYYQNLPGEENLIISTTELIKATILFLAPIDFVDKRTAIEFLDSTYTRLWYCYKNIEYSNYNAYISDYFTEALAGENIIDDVIIPADFNSYSLPDLAAGIDKDNSIIDNSPLDKLIKWSIELWKYQNEIGSCFEEEIKEPEYHGLSADELWQQSYNSAEREFIPGSLWEQAWKSAREQAKEIYKDSFIFNYEPIATDTLSTVSKRNLPPKKVKRISEIFKGTDKPNNIIWSGLFDAKPDINGQLSFAIDVANKVDKRGGKQANILYSLAFSDNFYTVKGLTDFDRRVYEGLSADYYAGNQITSANAVFHNMGGKGNPGASVKKSILNSIKKMMSAVITLDNVTVLNDIEGYNSEKGAGYKYTPIQYTGNLLYAEFVTENINGTVTDDAIHIIKEPIMLSFAKARNQYLTIKREILQIPLNLNNSNIRLEDYLIQEINGIKRKRRTNNVMLLDTIYKEIGAIEPKQKQRAKEKIITCLDYWKSNDIKFIKSYNFEKDKITIHF